MDCRSVTSSTSTLAGGRVQVVVLGSKTVAIPVDSSTSFADIEAEVLRRAPRLRVNVPKGDYDLHLDSDDGPLAFPDDLLVDVVDLQDRPTIWFQVASADVSCCTPSATSHSDQRLSSPYKQPKIAYLCVGLPRLGP
jgi:hypothetical protein